MSRKRAGKHNYLRVPSTEVTGLEHARPVQQNATSYNLDEKKTLEEIQAHLSPDLGLGVFLMGQI